MIERLKSISSIRNLVMLGAVLSLLIAGFVFSGYGFVNGDKAGIYWLEVGKIQLFVAPIVYFPITLVGLAIVLFLFARKKQLGFGILIVTLSAIAWVIVATLAGPIIGQLGYMRHVDTLRVDGYFYYLGAKLDFSVPLGDVCMDEARQGVPCDPYDYFRHEFIVFRCDSVGLFCRRINTERHDQETGAISHGSLGMKNDSVVLIVEGRQVWAAPLN